MHHKFIKRGGKRQGRRAKMKQARSALKGTSVNWLNNIIQRCGYGSGLSKGDLPKDED
jgi:hypothetical protein